MKCQECGKDYVLLANHVLKKHGIAPDDYRRKYNILLTEALADGVLREHLSQKARLRMLTQEGVEHIRRLLTLCDRGSQRGRKRNLPPVSIQHCLVNNEDKRRRWKEERAPLVLSDWVNGMSNRDISLKHGLAMCTLRKWAREGVLPKRKLRYALVGGRELVKPESSAP